MNEATVADASAAEPNPAPADPAKTQLELDLKYDAPLLSCRMSADGSAVYAGAEDNSVQRFDLATKTLVAFKRHDSWVRGIEVSSDGQTLYTAGYDGRLVWWPATAEKPEPIRTIDAHTGWIRSMSLSPDGKLLATAGHDLVVRLWDAASGERAGELSGHDRHIYRVRFSGDGKLLATGDHLGRLRLFDVAGQTLVREAKAEKLYKREEGQKIDVGGIRDLAFSGDGALLAASGLTNATNPLGAIYDCLVVVVDTASGEVKEEHAPEPVVQGIACGVRWHADGYWIAATGGGGGGKLLFCRHGEPKPFVVFNMPHWARDVDLSADGMRVAVAHVDKALRVYRLSA